MEDVVMSVEEDGRGMDDRPGVEVDVVEGGAASARKDATAASNAEDDDEDVAADVAVMDDVSAEFDEVTMTSSLGSSYSGVVGAESTVRSTVAVTVSSVRSTTVGVSLVVAVGSVGSEVC